MELLKNYINGRWVDAKGGPEFDNVNPADFDDLIAKGKTTGPEQVMKAVDAARKAFDGWRNLSMVNRAEYLDRFLDLVKNDKELPAELVTRECGKPEGLADVTEGIHMAQLSFGFGRQAEGSVIPSEIPEKDAVMFRKPKGVVAAISPWNFPFAIPLWQICPSLVYGNTVVFKPAEETPLSGQRIVEYFDKAGLPPGVLNLVHGVGEITGDALVKAPGVDVVLFTGSAEVGQNIRQVCASDFRKLAACEMGSKSAVIVLEDADIDIAVRSALLSAFRTSGQRCVSAGRIIVHEKILPWFRERFVEAARRIKVGNALKQQVFMGPMINEQGLEKVLYYNKLAKEEGGNVLLDGERLTGGDYDKGWFLSPFIFEREHKGSRVLREEVFGPHTGIVPVRSTEEAIEVYNDTDYGLALSVITEDFRKMRRVREEADYGLGYWNLPCIGAEVQLPFGGVKKSGTGFPAALTIVEAITDKVAFTYNSSREIKMAQGLAVD